MLGISMAHITNLIKDTTKTTALQVWFYLECLTSSGILSMQQITLGFTEMLKDRRIPEEVTCQAMSLLLASRVKLSRPVKQFRSMVRDIMYDGRQLHALGR